jgi:thiamine biosynthesis lipoprotein
MRTEANGKPYSKCNIKAAALLLAFSLTLALAGCATQTGGAASSSEPSVPAPAQPAQRTEFILDTPCSVTLYNPADEALAAEALALCQNIGELLDARNPDSDVSKINSSGGEPVAVSDATAFVLGQALAFSEISDGAFDVTVGIISLELDFTDKSTVAVFDSANLSAALPHIDYRNLTLSGNTATLKDPEAEIDLGGIAKGYIADEMADFLEESGVKSGIINLGGNVVTVGNKPDGGEWQVGVENPIPFLPSDGEAIGSSDKGSALLGRLGVKGRKSIGTSGIYQRYYDVDGYLYHHILDPNTGLPADTDLASVTVITDRSITGEGYSTIAVVLGADRARALLEAANLHAVLVKKTGEIVETNGTMLTNEP